LGEGGTGDGEFARHPQAWAAKRGMLERSKAAASRCTPLRRSDEALRLGAGCESSRLHLDMARLTGKFPHIARVPWALREPRLRVCPFKGAVAFGVGSESQMLNLRAGIRS